jgi:two-component system response regulator CpxR
MTRVLLADDDTELCSLMHDYFEPHGFALDTVHNGRSALGRALDGGYELFILDVMMPALDGFEVLRQLRKRSAVPVIMLTARTSPADRVDGLNSGADDYLPKPFDPAELLARMRAVLRRTAGDDATGDRLITCGSLQLWPDTREVRLHGDFVPLTTIEFDILECLARSAGRVVSRDTLSAAIYQREANPFERSLDVHVSHLRKKLAGGGEALIHTVRGEGYLLAVRRRAPGTEDSE